MAGIAGVLAFLSAVVALLGTLLIALLLIDYWAAKARGYPPIIEWLSLLMQMDDEGQKEELAILRERLKAQKKR